MWDFVGARRKCGMEQQCDAVGGGPVGRPGRCAEAAGDAGRTRLQWADATGAEKRPQLQLAAGRGPGEHHVVLVRAVAETAVHGPVCPGRVPVRVAVQRGTVQRGDPLQRHDACCPVVGGPGPRRRGPRRRGRD